MSVLETIILALIQAFTEFIPVSSSGHLLAAESLLSIESSLALDVILHAGTLAALVIYFWSTIRKLIAEVLSGTISPMVKNIIISTIPAALAGFFLDDAIESEARVLWVVIVMLVAVGVLMILSKRLLGGVKPAKLSRLSPGQAAVIGLGQALALIPGTSRSGITMLTGQAQGLSNKQAADYSFLIGIPIIFGATLKILLEPDSRSFITDNVSSVVAGSLVSAVVGFVVLSYLLRFVSQHGLAVFGWYRLGLALILVIIQVT